MIGLGLVLVISVSVAHFLLKTDEEMFTQILGVEPIDYENDSPIVWIFDEYGHALMEEKLFEPVREKFAIEDSIPMPSDCKSYVDYSLSSLENEVLLINSYYYGTLQVFLGCEESFTYVFRILNDGSELSVTNEVGEFLELEDWLNS